MSLRRACAALSSFAFVLLLAKAASADAFRPSGALTGHVAIADGDVGGFVLLDAWGAIDWLRIGGFVGAGAIPSDRDSHNRVMMPFGLSLAAEFLIGPVVAISLRARAGGWGGATQAEKIAAGVLVGGGAYLGFQLGQGALLHIGADVWGILASDAWRQRMGPDDGISASALAISPGISLSWTPGENAP